MGLRDFTLSDVVARNARLFQDRTALIDEGQRVTHGEYLERNVHVPVFPFSRVGRSVMTSAPWRTGPPGSC
mgnify:CR=1 FL=1